MHETTIDARLMRGACPACGATGQLGRRVCRYCAGGGQVLVHLDRSIVTGPRQSSRVLAFGMPMLVLALGLVGTLMAVRISDSAHPWHEPKLAFALGICSLALIGWSAIQAGKALIASLLVRAPGVYWTVSLQALSRSSRAVGEVKRWRVIGEDELPLLGELDETEPPPDPES